MTVMQEALNEAGVHVPMIKRVWLFVKDHPKKGAPDIAAVFKVPVTTIYSALSSLHDREMVLRNVEMQRMRVGTKGTHFAERPVYIYEVNPRMHGEYELWPLPVKEKKKNEAVPAPVPQAALVSPPAAFTPEKAIEGLSLAQARELFNYLHKIFKE